MDVLMIPVDNVITNQSFQGGLQNLQMTSVLLQCSDATHQCPYSCLECICLMFAPAQQQMDLQKIMS